MRSGSGVLFYYRLMSKIIGLLEKMGLVTSGGGSESVNGAAEGHPAATARGAADTARGLSPSTAPIPPTKLDVAALERQPGDQDYALEQVYASAGITPPAHGFTVYRLMDMLEGEEFRGLDAATRARVITGILRRLPSGAVEMDDIVRDAAARDRALDAFERFLADRVARLEHEADEKNRALQQQIDELTQANTGLMEANRATVELERARLERWRMSKRTEEDRLFAAVQAFVEHNPITREVDSPVSPEPPKA